ncbi:bifunctional riboflavin kinase/FAD synthetase [Arcanobacterium sp. S3PF19]|uniref:bifunctional riboflavin kinase/FAD synthetase n=1 Tax=Arcanobacterium sp. S3PF19 TaxID=1219585 RepID=UPI00050F423D|nr:bifunctional riboflavin kinase/FAD synthetase [Arcanobacterium sp. S3PF19]KGF05473.1 riboflavin kinase [Arcanobacterium sp. S3PF19]
MQIWHNAAQIPRDLPESAVTVGIFDGVHRGHRAILAKTAQVAAERDMPALALTFDPHPLRVHHPERKFQLITSLSERLARLEEAGIDGVFVQKYDLRYAQTTPLDFVRGQLLGQLHAKTVVVGQDVRFGKNNAGDGQMLKDFGARFGFSVVLLDDLCDRQGRRWSSTWVRELLAEGKVGEAMEVLGRPHRIRGIVRHGFKRGRKLGFPTANLAGDNLGEVPADGVYAGRLILPGCAANAAAYLPAAISVGTNPQFGGKSRTVEAHVLGRSDLNLYGQEIALDFISYLRPMRKFSSVAALLSQMDDDLKHCAQKLGVPPARRVPPQSVTAS